MKLKSITVKGYKSIKEVKFDLDYQNLEEQTYALVGNNESGKSSFLDSINLFSVIQSIEIDRKLVHKDVQGKIDQVVLIFEYEECHEITNMIKEALAKKNVIPEIISRISVESVSLKWDFPVSNKSSYKITQIKFFDNFPGYVQDEITNDIIPFSFELNHHDGIYKDVNLAKYLHTNIPLLEICYKFTHRILYWKPLGKYLMDKPINLSEFKENPREVSIPLANCFNLIGVSDTYISSKISTIKKSPDEKQDFISLLGAAVTQHIKSIWINLPIKVSFNIDADTLSITIEDDGVEHIHKMPEQRSDGFRHFISFILSVSLENTTANLKNSIILIDEPERHLHPQATELFKEELINLTRISENNNIVFYATHSLFMIDQNNISRNYRVKKGTNGETEISKISASVPELNTYAALIHDVFEVYTNDYHNQLYGYIQRKAIKVDEKYYKEEHFDIYLEELWGNLSEELKEEVYKKLKEKLKINIEYTIVRNMPYSRLKSDGNQGKEYMVTIPTKIRNIIHHPENTKHDFTQEELKASTEMLIKLYESTTTK